MTESGASFDRNAYFQELEKSGPLEPEYIEGINAAWEETSNATRQALAVIPHSFPFARKKRALIFKRLCMSLDRLMNDKKLRFENLGTVFIMLELFDKRFGKISQAALKDYARNEYLWQGLSRSASEFFSLKEAMVEVVREEGTSGFFGRMLSWKAILVLLWALMSELISGSLSTTWIYIFADFDSETEGVIVNSGRGLFDSGQEHGDTHNIRYAYMIDGNAYSSSQIDFESKIVSAAQKVRKYPEGKKVTVYYDAEQPYYSTLEKNPLGKGIYIQLVGIAVIFLIVYCSDFLVDFVAARSGARGIAERNKFVYRIPVLYRAFFIAILATMAIAEQGYLRDFIPSGDFFKPLFTIALIIFGPLLVFSPYSNSYLEFNNDHFVLPSLFIPPFRKRLIKYSDIIGVKESSDDNGYGSIVLKLVDGKAKISSHYCYDKTMLTIGSPDEYYDIRVALEGRLPAGVVFEL
jgi:hypothetical protein